MKTEEFVKKLMEHVSEQFDSYKADMEMDIDKVKDPIYRMFVDLCQRIDSNDKATLMKIMELAAMNAMSMVFGVIDGSSYFDENSGEFELKDGDGDVLNGDLQDWLWSEYQTGNGLVRA